uniref:Uncharacterized protein agf6 n=1 Tax=Sorogena stoianovitchae TaxID=164621 RepID=B1B3R6_SORST|nr:hypothetical protein [Sorogena stoianovitchae]
MKIAQILILSTLLVVALSVQSNTASTKSSGSSNVLSFSLSGILKLFTIFAPGHQSDCKLTTLDRCTPEDRKQTICTREIYEGCICFNNGTCRDAYVNKCSDCIRPEVYSVNKQKCSVVLGGKNPTQPPLQTPAFKPYVCPDLDPAVTLCAAYLRSACVCFKDGTCVNTQANKCSTCFADDVYSVNEGEKCPVGGIKVPAQPAFKIDICENNDPAVTLCAAYITDACVCYKNGTCVNTQANKCSTCFNKDVVSVNEGQKCPAKKLNGDYFRCQAPDPAVHIACTREAYQGCICYNDGTCTSGYVNACSDCQRENVQLVVRGACPAGGVVPNPNLSSEQPEDEYEPYVCPDLDPTRVLCPAYITNACVCYKNGTCVNTRANKCTTCLNNDVITANEGQKCPAKKLDGK